MMPDRELASFTVVCSVFMCKCKDSFISSVLVASAWCCSPSCVSCSRSSDGYQISILQVLGASRMNGAVIGRCRVSSGGGREILLSLSLRETSGFWLVNTLARERKTTASRSHHGCCLRYGALHFKVRRAPANAAFPFIALVITVKQVCLISLLLIWDEPLVCCFVYSPHPTRDCLRCF